MTDRDYLKKMITYVHKLEHSAEAEPFDRQIFHDTAELMQDVHNFWYRSRRRRSWFMIVFICLLICLVAWIAFTIYF